MLLEHLSPEVLMATTLQLERLRHDLGKYVTLSVRFAGEDASAEDLTDALRSDLLRTSSLGGQHEDVWTLWDRLRPSGIEEEPEVAIIDELLGQMREVDLEGSLARTEIRSLCIAARSIAAATKDLHVRALALAV